MRDKLTAREQAASSTPSSSVVRDSDCIIVVQEKDPGVAVPPWEQSFPLPNQDPDDFCHRKPIKDPASHPRLQAKCPTYGRFVVMTPTPDLIGCRATVAGNEASPRAVWDPAPDPDATRGHRMTELTLVTVSVPDSLSGTAKGLCFWQLL
jgi:hypothetical protein